MTPETLERWKFQHDPPLAIAPSPMTLSIYAGHSAAATSSREPAPDPHVGSSYIFQHPIHRAVDNPRGRSWGCRTMRGTTSHTPRANQQVTAPGSAPSHSEVTR